MLSGKIKFDKLGLFVISTNAFTPVKYIVLWDLGEISFDQGGYGESLQMRRRLHDIYLEISPNSKEMAAVCHNMGVCYGKLSLLDAAEESFTKALNIKRSLFPPGHDRIRSTERELHRTWQWKYGQ
jgi:tetratricopeptide (TPR) repeat protein